MAVCAECRERRALLVEFYDGTPSGFRIDWRPEPTKDMIGFDTHYTPVMRVSPEEMIAQWEAGAE